MYYLKIIKFLNIEQCLLFNQQCLIFNLLIFFEILPFCLNLVLSLFYPQYFQPLNIKIYLTLEISYVF